MYRFPGSCLFVALQSGARTRVCFESPGLLAVATSTAHIYGVGFPPAADSIEELSLYSLSISIHLPSRGVDALLSVYM
jgi:hypothetical protein